MTATASLRETALIAIKKKIQYGEWHSDMIMTEVVLCDELNISRTPVREALIQLVSDGIIRKVPHRGYAVVKFDQKSKLNLYVVYSYLDALAASLSANQLEPTDLLKMHECADKIDIALKYHNYADYYKLQDQFHKIYIDKCDNPVLMKLINDLSENPINRSYSSEDADNTERLYEVLEEANREHREIIRMFEEKDTNRLVEFLRNTHWNTKYPDLI